MVSVYGLCFFAGSHLYPSVTPLWLHDSREGNLFLWPSVVLHNGAFGLHLPYGTLDFSKSLRNWGTRSSLEFRGISPLQIPVYNRFKELCIHQHIQQCWTLAKSPSNSFKSSNMLMWSNDKCCMLFPVSFLVGESLDQIAISNEPHCLSLYQAKRSLCFHVQRAVIAGRAIGLLNSRHSTWVCVCEGGLWCYGQWTLSLAGIEKERKIFWRVLLFYFKWDMEWLVFCYSALSKLRVRHIWHYFLWLI